MARSAIEGRLDVLREWADDNRWKARFVLIEVALVASSFGLVSIAGPPPGSDTEPVLRVISGMLLLYAGIIAIIALIAYVGYAVARRVRHDGVGAAA